MVAPVLGAVGTYPDLVQVTSAAAKTEIEGLVDVLLALIPIPTEANPSGEVAGASPDFDQIPRHVRERLITELTALRLAVTNGA
jgi:hypothetical protein